jgi:simple sugar transport system ATP-binding protein
MAVDGHALIFISHKLDEIFALTDRVTVLRDGRVVGNVPTADVTKHELANMMVGREVSLERHRPEVESGKLRLELRQVNAISDNDIPILKNIDLEVRSGEILGVAGVSGNGQRPLAEAIVGLQDVSSGQILLEGEDVTDLDPAQMYEIGLSYIPEERMHDGVVKDFSVSDNVILQDHIHEPYSNGIFLNFKAIENKSQELVEDYNVKTPSLDTPVKNLSGGNIQKLILARELDRKPHILIAAQPTRGVDIGATEYIHAQLLAQRSEGLATLLISEDLDEVKALSDRIMVMFGGENMGIVNADEVTIEQLGLMMAGERKETALGMGADD